MSTVQAPTMGGVMSGAASMMSNPLAGAGNFQGVGSTGTVQGQAAGTTWDPTRNDVSDNAMLITYGNRRSLQVAAGAMVIILTAVGCFYYLFFSDTGILYPARHCQEDLCGRGQCLEQGDRAECLCPEGYSGEDCSGGEFRGQLYADGVMADCDVFLGLDERPYAESALAQAVTRFDGTFTFSVENIDALLSSISAAHPDWPAVALKVYVVAVPGSLCRSVATDVFMPAPMVLSITTEDLPQLEAVLAGGEMAVTPLSTLAWAFDASPGSGAVTEASRAQLGATGDVEYRMDDGSVNALANDCDAQCVSGFCTAVMLQNAVAVMQPLVKELEGEYGLHNLPWQSILFATAEAASDASFNMADESCLRGILTAAQLLMVDGADVPTAQSADFQLLKNASLAVLSSANSVIATAEAEAALGSANLGGVIRSVRESVQKASTVIGRAASESSDSISAVTHINNQLNRNGTEMSSVALMDYSGDGFQQRADLVVLPRRTVHSTSGVVISDGYYVDCRVYVDLNNDRQWAAPEPFGITDSSGRYSIDIASEGDSVDALVEPTTRVRLHAGVDEDDGDCTSNLNNVGEARWGAAHPLSGTVTDAAVSPVSSMDVDSETVHKDVVQRCIRSATSSELEPLIASTQIETAQWVVASLIAGAAATDTERAPSTWSVWQKFTGAVSNFTGAGSSEGRGLFEDAEQIGVVFEATVRAQSSSNEQHMLAMVEPLAAVTASWNAKFATEAREKATAFDCSDPQYDIVGGTCSEMEGKIDGGQAVLSLMRRQVSIRNVREQIVSVVSNAQSNFAELQRQVNGVLTIEEAELENYDINECISQPCWHGGKCEDRAERGGQFFCVCTQEYRGNTCTVEKLLDQTWMTNMFLEVSAMVGLSLVVLPVVMAVYQIQKYGLQKTRDIGGALAEGITAIGTKQVQTFDDHMAAGYTLLPGPLGEDDPSGRIPEEASVSLTTAMERGKTFNNPIIRRKRG